MGSSGSNGESLPKDTMKPVFLFEVIQTTVVPALIQKNWLFVAFGTPGLTFDELPALARFIHDLEDTKGLFCYKHVAET